MARLILSLIPLPHTLSLLIFPRAPTAFLLAESGRGLCSPSLLFPCLPEMVTVSARSIRPLGLSSRSISHAFCSQPKSELSSPILRALPSIDHLSVVSYIPYSSALFPPIPFLRLLGVSCLLDWSRPSQLVSLVVAVLLSCVSRADKSSSVLETGSDVRKQ